MAIMTQSLEVTLTPLDVSDLRSGMVLGEDVCDRHGRLLALEGTVVTTRLQRQLRALGTEIVHIDARTAPQVSQLAATPFTIATTANEVAAEPQTDPFMTALLHIARQRHTHRHAESERMLYHDDATVPSVQ